jgi:hypothetical protein
MRNGEIVDLANERRLSAALDFTAVGGDLLILNGGSRAEELVVVTVVDSRGMRSERREAYCIDSGTSIQLCVPLDPADSPSDVTLRIVGGHGEIILASPPHERARRFGSIRAWSTVAAAALLLFVAGGRPDLPPGLASADPEPAAADAPLIKPNVSLHVPAGLPNVVARAPVRKPAIAIALHPVRAVERHVPVVAMAVPAPVPKRSDVPETPEPRMTDLRVPTTAKSGDFVPVSFGAVARQVKIVASIGPTIVSKTIVGTQHGVIAIRSPKSDLDSRIMTVRAYAQNGNRTATLQAMVVLVHP